MKALRRAGLAALVAVAACSPGSPAEAPPVTGSTLLEVRPATIRSPGGTMSVVYGGEADPELLLSAGFLRRSPVGVVEVPSRLSWSPDSRRFFVNDSGGAGWSAFRLWAVDARAQATESPAIREAAIAELGRRNGCANVPEADATTRGMGWSPDGSRVYVLTEVRRQTGDCVWTGVDYIVAVADVETGHLIEVAQEGEARRRWPTLPWGLVTTP